MRKSILYLLYTMLCIVACTEEKQEPEGLQKPMEWESTNIKITENRVVNFPQEGNVYDIRCTNYNHFWFTNSDDFTIEDVNNEIKNDWFHAIIIGDLIQITTKSNDSEKYREVKVTVQAGNTFYDFKMVQTGR